MDRLNGLETVAELAARWRVPVSWIYSQTMKRGAGSIPRVRIGKYLRFIPEEVDGWLLARGESEA